MGIYQALAEVIKGGGKPVDFQKWLNSTFSGIPFSFLYGGIPVEKAALSWKRLERQVRTSDKTLRTITYHAPDGFQIRLDLIAYDGYDAVDWLLYLKNTGHADTQLISDLCSCAVTLPFDAEPDLEPGYRPTDDGVRLYGMSGSDCTAEDFIPTKRWLCNNSSIKYSPGDGRSSGKTAPFFDLCLHDRGVICAVGWTGQWEATFRRIETGVSFMSGIQNAAFILHPGEDVRTPSSLLLFYNNGQNEGHNRFRSLLRMLSPVGKEQRPDVLPLCNMSWGGMTTAEHLSRIEWLKKQRLGYDIYWIDAAWYGTPSGYCPSEHVGDWYTQAGNWDVNRAAHPDGLEPISAAVQDAGMDFLLWFEPERATNRSSLALEHPDWFYTKNRSENAKPGDSVLLNLGNPEARKWMTDFISERITALRLKWYRQDFNISPLSWWQEEDEPNRKGISELKHIAGLYQVWDDLLARHPSLMIDNCSSGGRRIDVETLRRSVPLWRSDYQCWWNYDPNASQVQLCGLSWWVPYHATGTGSVTDDIYRIRSCYGPGMQEIFWGYGGWEPKDSDPLDLIRKYNNEYKYIRKYFCGDYYPLMPVHFDSGSWAAWQFERPDLHEGIIQAFRREDSPMESACFALGGLQPERQYMFKDIDTGSMLTLSGRDLQEKGLRILIPKKRACKLYIYLYSDK